MSKKYVYYPEKAHDGKDALLEFVTAMKYLEQAHGTAVRMVRIRHRMPMGYQVIYELLPNTHTKIDTTGIPTVIDKTLFRKDKNNG